MMRSAMNMNIHQSEESAFAACAVTTIHASAMSGGLKTFEMIRADLSRHPSGMTIGSPDCRYSFLSVSISELRVRIVPAPVSPIPAAPSVGYQSKV